MRNVLLTCLFAVLSGQQAFAVWAQHLIVSPASLVRDSKSAEGDYWAEKAAALARGVTVRPHARGKVIIVLGAGTDHSEETGKGYYLIVSKQRLAQKDLNLRSAFSSPDRMPFGADNTGSSNAVPEGFVEVHPLKPLQRSGESVIEVVLDREVALRSYVVWDFHEIYAPRATPMIILDGGLWLTYDLPAFVEAADAAQKKKE